MNLPDARTELFRSNWSLYDAVMERNYMFHREIHACVREKLRARHARGSYSILDLGCGNARFLAPCLEEFPPNRYEGVDLSRAALADAAQRLKALPRVHWHEQDLLAAAAAFPPNSFDVIYSSFAAHHLDAVAKRRLFLACAAILAPGGEFLMVDVLRGEQQTRERYLEDYLGMMRTNWTSVDPPQLEEACRHVAEHDFPETFSTLTEMASAAGLGQTRLLDHFGQHHVLVFSR